MKMKSFIHFIFVCLFGRKRFCTAKMHHVENGGGDDDDDNQVDAGDNDGCDDHCLW